MVEPEREAVRNVYDRGRDLFDSDDRFQYYGGMIAAVRTLTGRNLGSYIGGSAGPSRPETRGLNEEARDFVQESDHWTPRAVAQNPPRPPGASPGGGRIQRIRNASKRFASETRLPSLRGRPVNAIRDLGVWLRAGRLGFVAPVVLLAVPQTFALTFSRVTVAVVTGAVTYATGGGGWQVIPRCP